MKEDKYITDAKGNVLKILDNHFLNLSPCPPSEKYIKDIDTDTCHIISYNNACMIINKQYNETDEKWRYEGKNYLANVLNVSCKDDIEEHVYKIRLLPNHDVVLDDNGPSELKMIRCKGKMYYILLINEKLPRVKAYDMFGHFVQWIGIKNCKPVFCEDDNEFI